jgi:Protein of unknown function (DUF2786)
VENIPQIFQLFQTYKTYNKMNNAILEKVKKLLDKANATDSVNEADAFMAKATEILRQHNLQMSDLDRVNGDNIGRDILGDLRGWKVDLMLGIAGANMVTVLKSRKNGYSLIGKMCNIEVVKFTYEFYCNAIAKLAELWYKNEASHLYGAKVSLKNDYIKGCVSGVSSKMKREKNIAIATVAGVKDMIRVNDNAVSNWISEEVGKTRNTSRSIGSVNSAAAYYKGKSDASGISVGAKQLA